MSQTAVDQLIEFNELYLIWKGDMEGEMTRNFSLIAKGLALQQAGIIPLEVDLDVIKERATLVELESLSSGTLMSR